MKAGELKPCALCGKGVMHTGLPLFYRVKIERMGVDANEVRRVGGLEQMMLGNIAIARVLYDPEIATSIGESSTTLVCEKCSTETHLLAQVFEAGLP